MTVLGHEAMGGPRCHGGAMRGGRRAVRKRGTGGEPCPFKGGAMVEAKRRGGGVKLDATWREEVGKGPA
jgi:hypothetical protein